MRLSYRISNLTTRFWSKVHKTDGCWLWLGAKGSAGYGNFLMPNKPTKALAHRVAYELLVGPIPDGLTIDHLCRVRACVRPDHMEPVTRGENTLRGDTLTAKNKAKTACPKGHPYQYVYERANGRQARYCGICIHAWGKTKRARVRELA